jgi:hypothetical protein
MGYHSRNLRILCNLIQRSSTTLALTIRAYLRSHVSVMEMIKLSHVNVVPICEERELLLHTRVPMILD